MYFKAVELFMNPFMVARAASSLELALASLGSPEPVRRGEKTSY